LPRAWIRERRRDYYYRRAKRESYRSRAAYKLLQAVEKYRFMRPGDVVVDLGAAPGGWTQAARNIVGEGGFVLAVDIAPIQPLDLPGVHAITLDVREAQAAERIRGLLPGPADVVVSDVSPNVSGAWELDHARQIDLARASLRIAASVLRPRGSLFVKAFQGDMLDGLLREVRGSFRLVRVVKPRASRARSAEVYILGMDLKKVEV